MRKINPRLFGILWTLTVFVLLGLSFTIAFFLTGSLYRTIGRTPPALAVQLINTFLGLFLVAFLVGLFSRIFRSQRDQMFTPIITALERIAKGDFSTRLDQHTGDAMLGKLVSTVNRMASGLDQMENMRQEFISNVSHEIQSPLTSIRGFAQALKNGDLSAEERVHYLEIIETESTRLSRLADDLLQLTSLEAEQVKFEARPYRLDQQVRSLILISEPQWEEKGLQVEVELAEITLTADEDLLSQVWLNLIHNSIKFTPPGGLIRVGLCAADGRVEFRISDSGIGISDADQEHIFERFYKADRSRTRTRSGSGLGLAIVKKIVEMHQGGVEVESVLGKGTTFRVFLPLQPAQA